MYARNILATAVENSSCRLLSHSTAIFFHPNLVGTFGKEKKRYFGKRLVPVRCNVVTENVPRDSASQITKSLQYLEKLKDWKYFQMLFLFLYFEFT